MFRISEHPDEILNTQVQYPYCTLEFKTANAHVFSIHILFENLIMDKKRITLTVVICELTNSRLRRAALPKTLNKKDLWLFLKVDDPHYLRNLFKSST